MRRVRLSVVGSLLLFPTLVGAVPGPVGSEFHVNTYTTDDQYASSVAADAAGNFVVVWQSFGQDGSGLGVFGQRYDSTGLSVGSESGQHRNFVVVWGSHVQDGSGYGVFGQRYDATGAPVPGRVPISGTRLALTDSGATTRTIVVVSAGPSVANGINPRDQPRRQRRLPPRLQQRRLGDSACFPLPAGGWVATNLNKAVYRYSDPTFADGPCNRVTIKRAGRLRAKCQSTVQPIPYSLDEAMQGSVGVNLTIGPATYCAVFGGTIASDSGATGHFRASQAPAPTSCPTPPASCP